MLQTVMATRFIRQMSTGRTKPFLVECEDADGNVVELIAKCSKGTFEGVKNLAIEAIAAMLGRDLDLPVPRPFVVQLDDDFISSVSDPTIRQFMNDSCRYAFGSEVLPAGHAAWPTGGTVAAALCERAAEIFVFDGIIVNSDRRPENPNCLFDGAEFGIFDHEMTLQPDQILFWKAPWVHGGFDQMHGPQLHIFSRPHLEQRPTNLNRFVNAWNSLPGNRFNDYIVALPPDWKTNNAFLTNVAIYLNDARQNIGAIVQTALGVLQ
ncbi:HipA family kinase [Burkholderia multivorans]|uniref:HipA family kinase n=1 Tax=Burkholderia multivorans TaxID=87883 RepID=UPI0021C20FB1|nr:HipA family kinase [Burkholderia multivorans]